MGSAKLGLCLLFPVLLHSPNTAAQTGRQVAQKAFPSTVLLTMSDAKGQPLSLGSGFFVGTSRIITNFHVIEGAAAGTAKLVGQKEALRIVGFLGVDDVHDLVLLSVSGTAPSLNIGDTGKIAVGDEVFVVGNPKGLEGTFSQGIVSGIRKVEADTLLQITAPISPGSSGGPVLNSEGDVIGVAIASFAEGQNLNFAVPGSYVQTLLSNVKPSAPLPVKTKLVSGRAFERLGGPNSRAIVATHILWLTGGNFSFSLKNNLATPVTDIRCLVIFYDRNGQPIHFEDLSIIETEKWQDGGIIYYGGEKAMVVPPGLAKRYKSAVSEDIRYLTSKVEFRVLDFRVLN